MKRFFPILVIFTALFFSACELESEFDESLLIGKWVSETLFYRYDNGGTGLSWDTKDDVSEQEAQPFTWTLVKSELTHIHILTMGGGVPKIYKVTELNSERLSYQDNFRSYVFTRVTD